MKQGGKIGRAQAGPSPATEAGGAEPCEGTARDNDQGMEVLAWSQGMDALKTFASGFAHAINNRLAVIMGFTELAQDAARGGRDSSGDLAQIMEATEQARDLVGQLLAFCGSLIGHLRPLDLNRQVRAFLGKKQSMLTGPWSIDVQLAAGLARVSAAPELIDNILSQLCLNAVQAMAKGGVLTITTANLLLDGQGCHTCGKYLHGPWVLLTVADNGPGMDLTFPPKVFQPFFSTKGAGEGPGLGLAAVHGIIKGHGGHIVCDSRPGAGTTFKICLPALTPSESPGK